MPLRPVVEAHATHDYSIASAYSIDDDQNFCTVSCIQNIRAVNVQNGKGMITDSTPTLAITRYSNLINEILSDVTGVLNIET